MSGSASRGFTLLEVLVAVAIVAVVAVAVGIGLSGLGGSRQLQREAERLQSHLQYACEIAQLNGRALGLRLRDHGYAFMLRRADQWQPVDSQPALAAYTLGAGVRLRLSRDGQIVQLRVTDGDTDKRDRAPDLICFASGELTPFRADLTRPDADQRFRLQGHADGTIELSHSDVPP